MEYQHVKEIQIAQKKPAKAGNSLAGKITSDESRSLEKATRVCSGADYTQHGTHNATYVYLSITIESKMKAKNKVGRPRKEPYVPVKVYLSEPHKAWIERNGGATKVIKELINQAINSDNKCHDDNICH